jgi:hypothetical protein
MRVENIIKKTPVRYRCRLLKDIRMDIAMTATGTAGISRLWNIMRWVIWGGAAFLLLLPLVAMQFTEEVAWTLFDFVLIGIMLGLVCAAFELVVRMARSDVYVIAAGVAVVSAFLMTWVNLAVGIIGAPLNPANLMFFGVIAIGIIAAAFSRLKSPGMVHAMDITAIAQAVASVITLAAGERYIFVLTLFFLATWIISGQLFRMAARQEAGAGEAL